MGPSDQQSFYEKKIPVFFFFTGDHPDYHRPSDTADKINFTGMARIANMVEDLIANLEADPVRPDYVEVAGGPTHQQAQRDRGNEATVGTTEAHEDDHENDRRRHEERRPPAPEAKGTTRVVREPEVERTDHVDRAASQPVHGPGLRHLIGGEDNRRNAGEKQSGAGRAADTQRPRSPPLLHATHSAACGSAFRRARAIGCPQRSQMP